MSSSQIHSNNATLRHYVDEYHYHATTTNLPSTQPKRKNQASVQSLRDDTAMVVRPSLTHSSSQLAMSLKSSSRLRDEPSQKNGLMTSRQLGKV